MGFQDVFASPAVSLLCELEEAALELGASLEASITPESRLRLGPRQVLTPDRTARVRSNRDALRVLVLCVDEGVMARRAVFEAILVRHHDPSILPALRYRTGRDGTDGRCVSCGEDQPKPILCWRCQLAARVARRLPVPSDWPIPQTATPKVAA
jgi:hypothetical protein